MPDSNKAFKRREETSLDCLKGGTSNHSHPYTFPGMEKKGLRCKQLPSDLTQMPMQLIDSGLVKKPWKLISTPMLGFRKA